MSTCEPSDSLERAAGIMWDCDCGAVPVVDASGVLYGIVTDRDLAMSAYLKGRPLAAISVAASMTRALHCCAASDTLESALAALREHQVHRLPVVDDEGKLVGMLALADVLLAVQGAEKKQRDELIVATFTTLAAVRRPRTEAPLPKPSANAPVATKAPIAAAPGVAAPVAAAPVAKAPAPSAPVTLTPVAPTAKATPPSPSPSPTPAKISAALPTTPKADPLKATPTDRSASTSKGKKRK